MTDTPPPPEASGDVPTSKPLGPEAASRETWWDWRPKARWFAAEIVVVVAGVLIALAINAWWADRQSAAQERVYLRQLAADLDATAQRLEGSVAAMERSVTASARLLIASTEPERADRDSVAAWVAGVVWHDRPSLALGVARALTASDLSVVQDDSVRTAIFELLTHADRYEAFDEEAFGAFLDYSNALRPVAPMAARMAATRDPEAGPDAYYPVLPFRADGRVTYPLDVDALLRSREAYTALDGLYDMASDLRVFQSFLLRRVRETQDVLARRGIAAPSDDEP